MNHSSTCVPTGINTGVSTSAWGSRMTAARALVVAHSATILSERAVFDDDEVAGAGLMFLDLRQVEKIQKNYHIYHIYRVTMLVWHYISLTIANLPFHLP